MNLHEHQAKALLAEYGVPIPRGKVAFSVDEAVAAASELGLPVVVKAQIHAGGRGKAGGVRLARTEDEVRAAADAILGATLVTKQTGPEGRLVRRLLVEEGVAIARELYVSFIIDRSSGRPMCIASAAGGMGHRGGGRRRRPEKILTVDGGPGDGDAALPDPPARLRARLRGAGLPERDEVPDRALPRLRRTRRQPGGDQPDCWSPRAATCSRSTPRSRWTTARSSASRKWRRSATSTRSRRSRVEASKHRLSYIKLDGSVGCMVNGAGLAMATMDIVKLAGASPANFLDARWRRQRGPDRKRLPHPPPRTPRSGWC